MFPGQFPMKAEVASCLKRCIWKRDILFGKLWAWSNITVISQEENLHSSPSSAVLFICQVKSCPGDVQSSHWLHNGKCITYLELTWLYLEWFNTLVIKNFMVWTRNINRWHALLCHSVLYFLTGFCTGQSQCVLVSEALPGTNPGPWAQCEQPGIQ